MTKPLIDEQILRRLASDWREGKLSAFSAMHVLVLLLDPPLMPPEHIVEAAYWLQNLCHIDESDK